MCNGGCEEQLLAAQSVVAPHRPPSLDSASKGNRSRAISCSRDFDLDLVRSRSIRASQAPSTSNSPTGKQAAAAQQQDLQQACLVAPFRKGHGRRPRRILCSRDFDLDLVRSRSIRASHAPSASVMQHGIQAAAAHQQDQQQDRLAAPWRHGHGSAERPAGQRLRPTVSRSHTSRTRRIDRSDHDAMASAQATRGGGMEGKRKAAMACIPYWDGGFAIWPTEGPFLPFLPRFSLPYREGGIFLSW